MNEQTTELVKALHAVNQHMPGVATGLLSGSLTASKQHQFAALLIELGELLHEHADSHTALAEETDPQPPALEPETGDDQPLP